MTRDEFEKLSAFVDREVGEAKRREIEEHLDRCSSCRQYVDYAKGLKSRLARGQAQKEVPQSLRARIQNSADNEQPSTFISLFDRRTLISAAVALGVSVSAFFALEPQLIRSKQIPEIAEAVIADHIHTVPDALPTQTGSDRDKLASLFNDNLEFSPVIPRSDELKLEGGRLFHIDSRKVELLFYKQGEDILSLFVSDKIYERNCYGSRGHTACIEPIGDLSLILTGTQSRDEWRRHLAELKPSQ